MIELKSTGKWGTITRFLEGIKEISHSSIFDECGKEGVEALRSATPVDSGATAAAWRYEIEHGDGNVRVSFHNDNINNGVNIAIILNFGHGTGTGGWVEGRNYIDPAIQPAFDRMAEKLWKEVTSK